MNQPALFSPSTQQILNFSHFFLTGQDPDHHADLHRRDAPDHGQIRDQNHAKGVKVVRKLPKYKRPRVATRSILSFITFL